MMKITAIKSGRVSGAVCAALVYFGGLSAFEGGEGSFVLRTSEAIEQNDITSDLNNIEHETAARNRRNKRINRRANRELALQVTMPVMKLKDFAGSWAVTFETIGGVDGGIVGLSEGAVGHIDFDLSGSGFLTTLFYSAYLGTGVVAEEVFYEVPVIIDLTDAANGLGTLTFSNLVDGAPEVVEFVVSDRSLDSGLVITLQGVNQGLPFEPGSSSGVRKYTLTRQLK